MVSQGCSERTTETAEIYDVVGIGFGPANLALAVAMEETEPHERLRSVFLEAKPSYVWHPGMLIEDSLLQITVLKDLILVENPCSRFTFLNYLKEKGRLYEFLNLRDLFPTRIEFNDYLTWAAAQLDHLVHYRREVLEIRPIMDQSDQQRPSLLEIIARDRATGETVKYLTRHLVLAAGGEPSVPAGLEIEPGGRAFHSYQFKQRIAEFADREAPYRFIVVGAGQSAGEIFEYLIDRYPNADVTATTRNFGYRPVDESDFTNRIFFPEWIDYYYDLPDDKRRRFFSSLEDVNYAAIDHPLIGRIYQKLYRMKVVGQDRARLVPFLELERLREEQGRVKAAFHDVMHEKPVEMEADALVLCTGYAWRKEHPLLDSLAPYFERDSLGGYKVERDYAVAARDELAPKVYLQGYCEDTHGISETVLSLLPVRAKEILSSIQTACSECRQVTLTAS